MVRLARFLEGFPGRNTMTSICNDDLSDALLLIAEALAEPFAADPLRYAGCLTGPLHDADSATAGVQPDCTVTLLGATTGYIISLKAANRATEDAREDARDRAEVAEGLLDAAAYQALVG